jgi:hypothetical protein
VITSVQSLSNDGNHVFEVPMLDPANIPSTAAGFPWKADGDFRTIIYAKNESLLPQKFATHLVYDGGQYSTGEIDIEPGQTIAVDFRELRDSQTPDKLNRVIPPAVDKGQIAWTKRRGQAKSLSVRSEQISVAGGIASTYSCANSCCDNRDLYGWVNPSAINEVVGGSTFINGTKVEENCFFQQFETPIDNAYWSSSDTDVEVIGFGTAEAVGPGYAEIHADWTPVWYLYGPSLCEPVETPRRDSAPAEVVGVQKIQYKVSTTWTDIPPGGLGPFCHGTSVDFRAVPTSGSFPSGKPTWGGDASGSGVEKTVIFSNAGSRTVSATAGNTVPASINVSAANNNINVTWLAPNVTTNAGSGTASAGDAPFVPEYIACADPGANEWKLRVKKVEGGINITIYTGGFRDPSASPPVSQIEAIDANTEMNSYYYHGKRPWHTTATSVAHENYHNSEWTCSANHYWGPTETALELLRVSYTDHNTEAAAITQMKTGTNGADAKMNAFRSISWNYWMFSLSDAPESRPYAAGQLVLNGEITTVVGLATTNGWTGVPGVANANPNTSNPCYATFPPYSP